MSAVYRVDKFVVPEQALEEFWSRVGRTHEVLRKQPGFLHDVLLEQDSGPGRFNTITIVKWSSADDLAAAKAAVEQTHREDDFRPTEFFERAGIEADLAFYREVRPE